MLLTPLPLERCSRLVRFACLSLLLVFASTHAWAIGPPVTAELLEVKMIWNYAPHNAFTDLVYWRDKWYCGFREGQRHVGDRGKMRIISSSDGEQWESTLQLEMADYDLRDAALSITPDDRLMILGGVQQGDDGRLRTGTFVSFSQNGIECTPPKVVLAPGRWLWRVTWHEGRAYGVSYPSPEGVPYSSLLVSSDGVEFQPLVPKLLGEGGRPTEARVRFAAGGTAYCLHRRDGAHDSAYLGKAASPYTEWTWKDLKQHFGGPNFLQLPSGHWIGAGRLIDERGPHTAITSIDVDQGTMTPLLRLPSGGDTSYPGLVWHEGQLWVSYYSSHEKGTNIYLARVAVRPRAVQAK
jgi:hypothetical protein